MFLPERGSNENLQPMHGSGGRAKYLAAEDLGRRKYLNAPTPLAVQGVLGAGQAGIIVIITS